MRSKLGGCGVSGTTARVMQLLPQLGILQLQLKQQALLGDEREAAIGVPPAAIIVAVATVTAPVAVAVSTV